MRVRMMSGVKRVTVLGPVRTGHVVVRERREYGASEPLKFSVIHPNGTLERGELQMALGPIKRDSKPLRGIERRLRRAIKFEYKALGRYLALHERSRRKRRNGWAKDLGSNIVKAVRKR